MQLAWPKDFNALVYVLNGLGGFGSEKAPAQMGNLAVFGPGDTITVAEVSSGVSSASRTSKILSAAGTAAWMWL